MRLRVHEIHPAVVHAPLALLPTAAAVDLVAALNGSRAQARIGRALWWAGAASGLFAGVAGYAASQEVKTEDESDEDMMWLHGIGNTALVAASLGIAAWRTRHRPSVGLAIAGLAASSVSLYTAYLGGKMVYQHGLGINVMPRYAPGGVRRSPELLSREAPRAFLRDAAQGIAWLFRRTLGVLDRSRPVDRAAFGVTEPAQAPIAPPL